MRGRRVTRREVDRSLVAQTGPNLRLPDILPVTGYHWRWTQFSEHITNIFNNFLYFG